MIQPLSPRAQWRLKLVRRLIGVAVGLLAVGAALLRHGWRGHGPW